MSGYEIIDTYSETMLTEREVIECQLFEIFKKYI